LLLAKTTFLFMPVSLMTAYFSCQFKDVEFTISNYWMWFGIIVGLSFVAICAFSVFSGTMEGKMMYKSISRRIYDVGRTMWTLRRLGNRAIQ